MRRQRGLTFIEMLVALLLLTLAVSGLLAVWALGFNLTRHSQRIGVGYNIARQEVERARNIGYMLLPEGTQTAAYDGKGEPAAGAPTYVATTTIATIPREGGVIDSACLRSLAIQVVYQHTGEVVFASTTYFSRGGV